MPGGRPPVVSIGDRYGCLVIAMQIPSAGGKRRYLCLCDCGAQVERSAAGIRKDPPHHCHNCSPIHGHARRAGLSATYQTWKGMLNRCTNEHQDQYRYYGARGIKVCDRWNPRTGGSFENFLADMGPRPVGMTLDRRDVDGDYEPQNCRWATWHEQRINQRKAA